MCTSSESLNWLLAALVAGFAFIGLSYLIPAEFAALAVILFILGALTVVMFAAAIVLRALAALLRRHTR